MLAPAGWSFGLHLSKYQLLTAILLLVVMETGLIHPPVGLNIFVINRVAPDIGLGAIIWGTLPFLLLMTLAVMILTIFPVIAMWLPHMVYK